MMGTFSLDDTIAAIATPLGEGGVGIVKISGPQAIPILRTLFAPGQAASPPDTAKMAPRHLNWGHIRDPRQGHKVDEVLAVVMPAPHSYTRQDVVEIQTHGGIVAVRHILKMVLANGARLAEPGDMTLRAFVNGRLDLAQAEAVLDIVKAHTDASLRVAVEQLGGNLSNEVRQLRASLVNVLAYLEASIDFVEDEIPLQDVVTPLSQISAGIDALLATADRGLIYRQGIRAAIVGKPNVGKSSLLNALLRGERAIVTEVPGTTRDTLEETINLQGVPLVLVDTAGIRQETEGEVERIGVNRSKSALMRADLALLVMDGSQVLTQADRDIGDLIQGKPVLVVLNKQDLPQIKPPPDFLPAAPRLSLSALTGEGVEAMEQVIIDMVLGGNVTVADTPMVSNPRHQALLEQANQHVQAAIQGEQNGLSTDLLAIDAREAVDALGEITGESASQDLLEAIFSQFCIGK